MRQFMVWGTLVVVSTIGCGNEMGGGSTGGKTPSGTTGVTSGDPPTRASTGGATSETPDGKVIALSPANTLVEFVCAHTPPAAPAPRKGGFDKFTGKAIVDPAAQSLLSVSIEFDTKSIRTEVGGRLTDHLKSNEFFDVEAIPTASFRSAKVEPGEADGAIKITGDLTLHGVTKEISIPATIAFDGDKFSLKSKFSIDRTDYGMNYNPAQAEKEVGLTIEITEK